MTLQRRGAPGLSALELLGLTLDPGSFVSWDQPAVLVQAAPEYAAQLAAARKTTGLTESVVTGCGRIGGRRVAAIASDFRFLGGSIGVAAAELIVRTVERATAEQLPVVAMPMSGGTRMQEGTVAFACMVKIAAVLSTHKSARLPYIVYLRNPTTGGTLASWGTLGHVTYAEPGSMIGFLGPRVYEALYGEPFPCGVQVAENLYERGIIDAVVPPGELADLLDRTLTVLCREQSGKSLHGTGLPSEPIADVPAWESVLASRREDRPGIREVLRYAATDTVFLSGTTQGEREAGLLLALTRFGGVPCVVIAQDRAAQQAAGPLGPGALRTARRGMELAASLDLPLVSVLDTPGAALSQAAEEGGLAGEIARCMAGLVTLDAPTLCLVLGQGCGGGAMALLPADRVVAAQHAWISPLPPEGASVIVYHSTEHARELAESQGIRSVDLLAAGIVDSVVPELSDAADERAEFCSRIGHVLQLELTTLIGNDPRERIAGRVRRYRRIGTANVITELDRPAITPVRTT